MAAVEEILRSSLDCILICTNSNSAADEIAVRLTKVLKTNECIRIYAKSFNAAKIKEEIKKHSNWVDGEIKYPSLKFIYTYRVVICTLSTSGHLMRARNRDKDFDPQHFKYLIIDECASTTETMTMVPIVGMFFDSFFLFFVS